MTNNYDHIAYNHIIEGLSTSLGCFLQSLVKGWVLDVRWKVCRKAQKVFHIVRADLSASEEGVYRLSKMRPLGAFEDCVFRGVFVMTVKTRWVRSSPDAVEIFLEAAVSGECLCHVVGERLRRTCSTIFSDPAEGGESTPL